MDEKRRAVQELIEKRKERVVQRAAENVQLVVVSLADQLYAFPGSLVKAIAFAEQITPIPGTLPSLMGVIYFQGAVESVLDLKKVLGLGDTARTRDSRIVLVEAQGLRSGILVDGVEDVVDWATEEILPPLTTVEQNQKEYIAGEADYHGRTLVVLDLALLFRRVLAEG